MRIAHQFGRHDVDSFLADIDAEEFADWCEFFGVEPQGWQAFAIAIQKITFITAQSHSSKTLKERDFEVRFNKPESVGIERVRWEAFSVQQEVAAQVAAMTGTLDEFEGEVVDRDQLALPFDGGIDG